MVLGSVFWHNVIEARDNSGMRIRQYGHGLHDDKAAIRQSDARKKGYF
jgi:hypothetical protein